MTEVKEAEARLSSLCFPHLRDAGCLPESDEDINAASRAVVEAMHREHGEAWLGKVNLHGSERHGALDPVWKWDPREPIYTFGSAFVLPRFDAEVDRLIRERDDAEYTGSTADAARLDAIFAAIKRAGGVTLAWT